MLVFSRKDQESVMISVEGLDQPIKVTIASIKGDTVRIGVEHPDRKAVVIDREEVFKDKEMQRSVGVRSASMVPRPRPERSLALRGL